MATILISKVWIFGMELLKISNGTIQTQYRQPTGLSISDSTLSKTIISTTALACSNLGISFVSREDGLRRVSLCLVVGIFKVSGRVSGLWAILEDPDILRLRMVCGLTVTRTSVMLESPQTKVLPMESVCYLECDCQRALARIRTIQTPEFLAHPPKSMLSKPVLDSWVPDSMMELLERRRSLCRLLRSTSSTSQITTTWRSTIFP